MLRSRIVAVVILVAALVFASADVGALGPGQAEPVVSLDGVGSHRIKEMLAGKTKGHGAGIRIRSVIKPWSFQHKNIHQGLGDYASLYIEPTMSTERLSWVKAIVGASEGIASTPVYVTDRVDETVLWSLLFDGSSPFDKYNICDACQLGCLDKHHKHSLNGECLRVCEIILCPPYWMGGSSAPRGQKDKSPTPRSLKGDGYVALP